MTAQPRPPYGSRHRRADHPRGPRTGPARPAGRHGGGHHRALQGAGGIAHARPLPFDDAPTVVLDRIPAGWFDAPTKPIPVVVPRPRGPVGNLSRPEPSTPDPARTTTAPATPYGEASGDRKSVV